MQELIEADTFKIEMQEPYSPVYMTCIEEAKRDLRAKARPELWRMEADRLQRINLLRRSSWNTSN